MRPLTWVLLSVLLGLVAGVAKAEPVFYWQQGQEQKVEPKELYRCPGNVYTDQPCDKGKVLDILPNQNVFPVGDVRLDRDFSAAYRWDYAYPVEHHHYFHRRR